MTVLKQKAGLSVILLLMVKFMLTRLSTLICCKRKAAYILLDDIFQYQKSNIFFYVEKSFNLYSAKIAIIWSMDLQNQ
jgi:hypothetical protein